MTDDDPLPTMKSSAFAHLVKMAFLQETAHLGPAGQRRVLAAILAANRHRNARVAAAAAIDKARGP
jgi:hypothetical protein